MRSCRLKILATAAAFAGVVAFAASPAFAVHDIEPFPGAGVDTFELDNGTDGGNAIDESDINAPNDPTPFPDDWGKIDMGVVPCVPGGTDSCGHVSGPDDLANPDAGEPDDTASQDSHDGAHSIRHVFIQDPDGDDNNDDIYTQGGSKDDLDVSQWKHTLGSTPDKDDLLAVGAAAYSVITDFGDDGMAGG